MNPKPRTIAIGRWTLRILGLAVFFLFAAAPLPGETPGCGGEPDEIDTSPELLGENIIAVFCGLRCIADCNRLVECDRYPGPARGAGYNACVTECTNEGRNCLSWTLDTFCPLDRYSDRIYTEYDRDTCLADAEQWPCWCEPGQDCWDPALPNPPISSCTPDEVCDPR